MLLTRFNEVRAVEEDTQVQRTPSSHMGWLFNKFTIAFIVLFILIVIAAVWLWQRSSSEDAWVKATEYYQAADYESAAKELEGLDIPDDDQERLNVYAQSMLATKQLDNALDGYQRLHDLSDDPFAKMVVGNIYVEQENDEQAIKTYTELISTNPTYTQVYVNLAMLHRLNGNVAEAIETAQQGQANNPGSTVLAELLVSLTLNDAASEEHQTALSILRNLDPNNALLEQVE